MASAAKVLHVITGIDAVRGGPVAALFGLAIAQQAAGLEVTVLATTAGDDVRQSQLLRDIGVNVRLVGPVRGPLGTHPALKQTVIDLVQQNEVIHIHGIWEQVQHLVARECTVRSVPYVFCPCGMLDPWSLAQKWLKKRLYMAWRLRRNLNHASAIHYCTEAERDACHGLNLGPAPIVEPNGVDLAEFAELPPRGSFRSRYPQIADRPVITFLGRIHPGKGLEYLVPAIAKLHDKRPVLLAIGPDSNGFQATIEAEVDRLGLKSQVIFTGMLRGEDKVAALADSDLFCLPSDHENFGIAVIEALAAGLPVIVSNEVGIQSAVTAAGVGAAVTRDVDALAAELHRWLTDETLRKSAGRKARPFVWERYDWAHIAGRWAGRYARLSRAL